MSLEGDLLRPVLSMPPVILMDNSVIVSNNNNNMGGHSPRINMHSIPPSPIVEMPPSPAPSQMHMVEFPSSEQDVYEYDENGELVEVCFVRSETSSLTRILLFFIISINYSLLNLYRSLTQFSSKKIKIN